MLEIKSLNNRNFSYHDRLLVVKVKVTLGVISKDEGVGKEKIEGEGENIAGMTSF